MSNFYRIQNKKKSDFITLVLDHNPTIIDPSQIIKENCKSLALLDKITSGKKKMPKILTARRQPMNLLRILSLSIKRDHKLTKSNTGNFEKCKDARCLTCQQVIVILHILA